MEDGSLGAELGGSVDAGLQLPACALAGQFVGRADVDRVGEVNDQVEAVVGGSRPDRAGVDGVPGEARLHVQFDVIEASVGGSGDGRPVVAAVFPS